MKCTAYLCLLSLLLQAAVTQAQPNVITDQDVLGVSTLAVNESSFAPSDDPEAIAITIRRRAEREGISPAEVVARYHRRIGNGQSWIRGLNLQGTEPEGWPSNLPWSTYRGRWASVLTKVRRGLSGQSNLSCNATTWGSPRYDRDRIARMLSSGEFRYAPCGVTRNSFLVRVKAHRR